MIRRVVVLSLAVLFSSIVAGLAHGPNQPPHQLYKMRPQTREWRDDQGLCNFLRHPRQSKCQEVECHPDGHGD